MVTNWPKFFVDLAPHLGWILGLIADWTIYFAQYGQWRNGARPPLYMAVGGFAVFLAGPVLPSNLF